jgi:hypothetical protein
MSPEDHNGVMRSLEMTAMRIRLMCMENGVELVTGDGYVGYSIRVRDRDTDLEVDL